MRVYLLLGFVLAMEYVAAQDGLFEMHNYQDSFVEKQDSLLHGKSNRASKSETTYFISGENASVAPQTLWESRNVVFWLSIVISLLALGAIFWIAIHLLPKRQEQKNLQTLKMEMGLLAEQHKELAEKYKGLLAAGISDSVESVDQRLLRKAIEAIEFNMSNPLFGVDLMARHMAMSRTNLHRKIKAITGISPSELIRNVRLKKAALLLINKADSVSQISFIVGFEDQSYFSKAFKKQFGVSPSEYAQSMRENESVTKENDLTV